MLAAGSKVFPIEGSALDFSDKPVAWKQIIEPVQPFLEGVSAQMSAQAAEFDSEIATFANYVLASPGKQLRSILVGYSGKASGTLSESHTTVSIIIEMVHL